jgi:anti-sigma factor RsiW
MTDCSAHRERLEAAVYGLLDAGERDQMRAHLRSCESCRALESGLARERAALAAMLTEPSRRRSIGRWAAAAVLAALIGAGWLLIDAAGEGEFQRSALQKSIEEKDRVIESLRAQLREARGRRVTPDPFESPVVEISIGGRP